MRLLLDIKDEKAPFILELLKNFEFVKTKKLSSSEDEVLEGIKEAVEEMKLINEGKLNSRPVEKLISEL